MTKQITPTLNAASFTCPYCGAHANQTWHALNTGGPLRMAGLGGAARVDGLNPEPAISGSASGQFELKFVNNLNLSHCFSCKRLTVWVVDKIVWPATSAIITPIEDMPQDVREVFLEAAAIVDASPRGAAALLRLAVERLMPHLDAQAKNVNASIGLLVAKGLDPKIQKALDVLRVMGNEAVHPGQIDLKDDKDTALKLFNLVNIIVQALITTPNHINSMFESLPPNALAGIQKRDGRTGK
ncbi:DUF4145 domain-containing protein [Bradyrhizobium sp. USDA 336]|uniref:DUF4145 domain-containing protein n=1 Tax=Bradyrhizobium sp. USDA 336 TaxID=3156311 RepID=UPI0038345C09